MKVAVLLYGQPRYLDNKDAITSQNKFVLDKYSPDVFAHTWYRGDKKDYPLSHWHTKPDGELSHKVLTSIPHDDRAISKIQDRYRPKKWKIEEPINFTDPKLLTQIRKTFDVNVYTEWNTTRSLSQAYTIEEAGKLCEENKTEYDFLVWLRTDLHIKNMPDLNDLDPNCFYLSNFHPNFCDLCFISGGKYLNASKIYSYMTNPNNYKNIPEMPNAHIESFKHWTYRSYYDLINYKTIKLSLDLVRSN